MPGRFGGRGGLRGPSPTCLTPMSMDGVLISFGGTGLGVMSLQSSDSAVSHATVWAIMSTPRAPESQAIHWTFRTLRQAEHATTLGVA